MRIVCTIDTPIAALVCLVLCVVSVDQSKASTRKRDLDYAFQNTQVVVDATVLESELFEWTGQLIDRENPEGESSPIQVACGSKVKLRINKTYSGSYEGEIEVGVHGALVTGRRYLLFLDERSDFNFSPPFGYGPEESDQCLGKLPPLKMNWNYSSDIAGRAHEFLVLSIHLGAPDELKDAAFTIESSWFVNGEELDYAEVMDIQNPTASEKKKLDRFFQIRHKASAICDDFNSRSPCHRYTVLPFKKVDEWLDRQNHKKGQ